jgi:ankyrin repeat protein
VQLPRYGLRADHHKLVKFSPADRLYEDDVKPYIQQIVHKALDDLSKGTRFAAFRESGVVLGEPPELRRSRSRTPQVTTTSEGFPPRAGLVPLGPKIDNAHAEALAMKPGLTGIDENRIGEWIQETINELGYYHSNRQMDSIDEGSRSTCDWILSKPLFKLWASSSTNAILFVEGSAGLGKSVLAKFVVGLFKSATGWEDFDETDQQKTTSINKSTAITAHFFCKRTGSLEKYNSPKTILMHVLFQIWEADPECFRSAARSLFNRVNERRGFEFYWSLFNAVRRQLNRPLFCIIDGLDECIHEYKSRSKADVKEKMEKFLRNLCNLAKEQESGGIEETTISPTKVFLTTRPALEVDNATFGSNFVLPIQETDTKECVKSFIEGSVRALSQRHRLSEPTEQFIKEEIARKSGHVFQTARTALTNLTKEWHDLEDKNLVARLLERVNSRNLDDAYEETLENIPIADQVKVSRIIRILYFAQAELTVEELSHIFLDKVDNPTSILAFTSSKGSLEVFVRSNLGQLIRIDDKGVVEFQHQTIREFFSDLSPNRWPLYNCKDTQAGHLHLALLCIQYLLSWRHQTVSPEELEARGGNEDAARFDQSKFLFYASYYWEDHVREAGNLIVPHISLVDKLLGFGDNDTDDYRYMCLLRTIDPDHAWRPVLPTSFIASFNLVHVLKAHIKPKVEVRRSRLGFLRPEKPKVHECNGLDPDLRNWDGSTALHHASRNASVEAALYLLDCGSDPTTRDSQNHTPFSLAVQAGCVEIAEVLAERLQSFHEVDMERNLSILHRACTHGMHKVVARLVSIGADPNSTNIRGETPIMVAAGVGHVETVKVLIKEHVVIGFKMPDGTTALHVAAQFGHVGVLELLFTAEPALDPAPANSNGDTPLHLASRYEHFECFKFLYSLKSVVQKNGRGWLPVHEAARNGHTSIIKSLKDSTDITALTNVGLAPLHLAAANGHLDAVKLLVKLGCEFGMGIDTRYDDLTLPEDDRLPNLVTPLYFAANFGHRSTIEFLISQNADITVQDSYGQTLLHATARYDFSDLFQLLLNRGLDPFARAAHGFTPLFFAAHAGSVDIVEIYLNMDDSQREYLDFVSSDGDTALYTAISANNTVIAKRLILRGIGIGSSSLHAAARLEDISTLTLLLDREISVDYADSQGRTALHFAAEWGNLAACKLLVERGANKNVVCEYGQTPLMKAAERFSADCVRYFLGIRADAFMYDASGLSVFDYCENFAPIMDLLRPLIAQGSMRSFEERQSLCRSNVRKLLDKLNKKDPSNPDFDHRPLDQLRLCFLHMREYDAARVCIEHGFRKSGKDETIPGYWCDKCRDIGTPGSFWFCKTCANTGLCDPCYEKHIADDPVVGCSADHEYLELGGERWKNLEKGKVNAEGQTLKEWIDAMIEKYGVEDEAMTAITADANPETVGSAISSHSTGGLDASTAQHEVANGDPFPDSENSKSVEPTQDSSTVETMGREDAPLPNGDMDIGKESQVDESGPMMNGIVKHDAVATMDMDT